VDSLGRPRSLQTLATQPQPGQTVRLTLDTGLQLAAQNALKYGIQLARNNKQWAADGGAIVAMSPQDGSILALASSPTYDPSVYSGRVTEHRLAAQGLTKKTGLARNYPGLDRTLDATYPPGSTFKPLTAIAALQEHLIKPRALYPCTGTYTSPDDSSHHVFHNWDPFVYQGMNLPTALAYSCDTYFYRAGNAFYDLPPDRGQPLQMWARKFGFGRTTGVDVGPETAGLVPTIGWKHSTYTRKTDTNWRIDRLWKPGDSITLAIGQGNLLVTPIQMARLYAAIANGGKLVTPHVLNDVENPNGTIVPTTAPPAPRLIPGLDPANVKDVQQGLLMGTHEPVRHVVRRLRQLPSVDRGQDRHGGEGRDPGARLHAQREPIVVVWLWSGERPEARRLRRDREWRRGWRGCRAGGRARLREVLRRPGESTGTHPLRLMLEYAGSQRAGLRVEREAPRLLSVVRSLDWGPAPGSRGARRRGASGASPASRSSRSRTIPPTTLNRQILYACVGGVVLVIAALIDPDLYRRYWRAIFIGTSVVIAFVLLAGHSAHGSTRWISLGFFTFQPSEFGKLLFVLAIAGMLAERQRVVGTWDTTLKVVGIGLIPAVLVFIQPDLGTALVYMAALAAMLFIAGIPLAPPRRCSAVSSCSSRSESSGPGRRPA